MDNTQEAFLPIFILIFAPVLLVLGPALIASGLSGSFSSHELNQAAIGAGLVSLIGAALMIGGYLFLLHYLLSNKRENYLFALNVFSNSQRRKKSLQEAVLNIARNLSSAESDAYHGIVRELGSVAGKIGSSGTPALVLANLAASFPELKQSSGFIEAQRQAVEIEGAIDRDRRDLNSAMSNYNSILNVYPNERFATKLKFSRLNYSEEDLLLIS